jgi:preprotein translocase subunit SecG
MENVVLIIHLILALCLIAVVLMQRSEGGGLGVGGGGGGAVSGRSAATALGKLTWFFGVCFLVTSITLTIIVAKNSAGASVIDRLSATPPALNETSTLPAGDSLLPPTADGATPLVPAAD